MLCTSFLLCAACDPINEIRRDFTFAEPIGDACVSAAIELLKTADPQRKVKVIQTPVEGVEEILVLTPETSISCIRSGDSSELQLAYFSTGSIPEGEIRATKKLMAEVEAAVRRSCVAGENMELESQSCKRMNCETHSP